MDKSTIPGFRGTSPRRSFVVGGPPKQGVNETVVLATMFVVIVCYPATSEIDTNREHFGWITTAEITNRFDLHARTNLPGVRFASSCSKSTVLVVLVVAAIKSPESRVSRCVSDQLIFVRDGPFVVHLAG
jgi:hypothetical protein